MTNDPHNYNSVTDMVNAGLQNMTVLVDNVAYDDNTYTIKSPPSWLKFNNITPNSIYASGNTWFGIGSSTEHIKFNRRDTKMYYLYREDGMLCNYYHFLKLRWRGYSAYNKTTASYLQEWEVYFFDTGDVMIRAVNIPSDSYNGTFSIVASQTYTYTPLTAASPAVSFYSQNDSHSVFEIKYELIDLNLWQDKWLIEDGGIFYNISGGELNPLDITEVSAQNMTDYGNDEPPGSEIMLQLTEPKLHRWNDSDLYLEEPVQPVINVHMTARPFPQTMVVAVDMSHETILGINGVTAQYSGDVTVCYSLDDGETYSDEEALQDFLNEDFDEIFDELPESRQLYLRFVFTDDAALTNVRFSFNN